jgi:ABC-type multidrug transport system, permease component
VSTTTETPAAVTATSHGQRRGALYVAEHQFRAMLNYKWTVVMTGAGGPLAYLLGIGLGLATLLDADVGTGPDGPVRYVVFVAPALLASAAVSVATEEFTYTVMSGFKWRRVFWGINATPVEPGQIVGGLVIAVAGRMLFGSVLYLALMLLFGAVGGLWTQWLLPLVGVLGGLAFGLPLLAYSATLKDDSGQFAAVQRFVFTPLFLFSGTFYPLETLPSALQWIGWISPLWHASELGRALSYGEPVPGWLLAVHAAVLVALAVSGYLVARRVFTRRLR